MKKLILILFGFISIASFSQVSSPDSLSIGGTTYIDSVFIRNDSLLFRIERTAREYGIARYTTGGGEPPAAPPSGHYVSSSLGDDVTGNGSQEFPWETLAYAHSQATSPGDSILLMRGDVFPSTSVLNITNGGSSGNPIVWNGSAWGSGLDAIIQKSQYVASAVRIVACDYVIFENITIDGQNYNGSGIIVGGYQAVYGAPQQANEDSIILQDCKVMDIGTDGWQVGIGVIAVVDTQSYIIVRRDSVDGSTNHGIAYYPHRVSIGGTAGAGTVYSYIGYNVITNCGQLLNGVASGIMITQNQDSAICEHNVISSSSSAFPGIAMGHDQADPTAIPKDCIVRYNDVRMTGNPAFQIQLGGDIDIDIYYNIFSSVGQSNGRTVYIQSADYTGCDINFYNNAIISEGDNGVTATIYATASGTIDFTNNSLVNEGTGTSGYRCLDGSTAGTYTSSYNNYYKQFAGTGVDMVRDGATIYERDDLTDWEATAVEGDPTFHTEFSNLHGQTGSILIDAGVNIPSIPQLDFKGTAVTNPPYIGIFESIED